ncbi:tripartite tricarboxylate transporter TctB family protein [Oricola sp.]|uniref:tripartite tricarboxylate transporter TctB family protein n=1 Tax=Oricola sp. TaxID=1979950 RepID=UPI0025D36509|nr:tripartite tricarboxylate transporter TctB family protein [Oricola sp.]MCI5074515.1 tripartite tricarboxylate transporter TctB family protein [Oricola sp.]
MALKHEDTVSGGALTAFGAAVVYLSLGMGTGAAGATLPPNFFPLLCAFGLMVCGLLLVIRGLRAEATPLPGLIDSRVAVVGGLLFIFYWFFAALDFRVAAAVLTFVTIWSFGHRSVPLLTILPLVLAFGLYFAFTRGFQLVLPTWI